MAVRHPLHGPTVTGPLHDGAARQECRRQLPAPHPVALLPGARQHGELRGTEHPDCSPVAPEGAPGAVWVERFEYVDTFHSGPVDGQQEHERSVIPAANVEDTSALELT